MDYFSEGQEGAVTQISANDCILQIVGSLIIFVLALIFYFKAKNNDKFTGIHIYFSVSSFFSILSGIVGIVAPSLYGTFYGLIALIEVICSVSLSVYAFKTDHKGWGVFFILLLLLPIIAAVLLLAMLGVLVLGFMGEAAGGYYQ